MDADLNIEDVVLRAMKSWSNEEMVWGKSDCMLAVADVVKEITGEDPAEEYRGRYRTRLGAYRVLGRGGTLAAAKRCARSLGWRSIDPERAETGAVGLIPILVSKRTGSGHVLSETLSHAAAICRSKGWFIARSKRGFMAVRSSGVSHAWVVE